MLHFFAPVVGQPAARSVWTSSDFAVVAVAAVAAAAAAAGGGADKPERTQRTEKETKKEWDSKKEKKSEQRFFTFHWQTHVSTKCHATVSVLWLKWDLIIITKYLVSESQLLQKLLHEKSVSKKLVDLHICNMCHPTVKMIFEDSKALWSQSDHMQQITHNTRQFVYKPLKSKSRVQYK